MNRALGVDVGGTFTDIVRWDGERLTVGKATSTPDQSDGVVDGARRLLDGDRVGQLVHGTTVATNALLERDGVEVALVTTAGFEDLIEIGRQHRPSLYDADRQRPAPLVSRPHRLGWGDDTAARLRRLSVGAVAVSLLYSYRDAEGERAVLEALGGLDMPMVLSHRVTSEFREFERTSTTVINAYLEPKVADYLDRLDDRVIPELSERLMVMRSSGGLISPQAAARLSAAILLSGPAGGVVAAAALGGALGRNRVISFDMGGTSTDVCRIEDGHPEVGYERELDGFVVRMPSVAVHTVGAGGGSIGWADPGGALRVGPHSAGADPGPVSYGRGGTRPAVTDAHVELGRLSGVLADGVELDRSAARAALDVLGAEIGLGPSAVALGMLEVVEATMERAVRAVSIEEGADPSEATLVAFGGAGGLHASALSRRLEMAAMVVPPFAGVFSALGLLMAPPRADAASTVLTDDIDQVRQVADRVAAQAGDDLERAVGLAPDSVDVVVDMRYRGQAHETTVRFDRSDRWESLCSRFHRVHHERNGFSRQEDGVEAVTIRAVAVTLPTLTWGDLPLHRPEGDARRPDRTVTTGDGIVNVPVWWRPGMHPGQEVTGPCIIEDGEATTWLESGDRGVLHDSGALEVTW